MAHLGKRLTATKQASRKSQKFLINHDGSVRVNLNNPDVRKKILEQVELAQGLAQKIKGNP